MRNLIRSETKKAWLFLSPAFVYLLIVTIFPFIYLIFASLHSWYLPTGRTFVGFKNYANLINDSIFWSSLKVTLLFVGSCLFFEHLIGFIVALLLSLVTKFRGSLAVCFVVPMMLPPITAALIWKLMYRPTGVLNWFLQKVSLPSSTWVLSYTWVIPSIVITDVWQWSPFVMLILLAGINAIPQEIFEATEIDGGGFYAKVRYIILPFLRPLLIVSFLLRFIFIFTTFDIITGLSGGGPGHASMTLYFYSYLKSFQWLRVGEGGALSMVIFGMTFGVGIFLLRKILKPGEK